MDWERVCRVLGCKLVRTCDWCLRCHRPKVTAHRSTSQDTESEGA